MTFASGIRDRPGETGFLIPSSLLAISPVFWGIAQGYKRFHCQPSVARVSLRFEWVVRVRPRRPGAVHLRRCDLMSIMKMNLN